ncbi:hypothetical protein ACFPM7_02850 [Actinokineospora guangxiensis]|uniref:XRE family transcriptional regulator n=1 Tax=Actinokineospora guangxiensis TaxID=1490288 RepID=A0ABW0EI77_9PSEU
MASTGPGHDVEALLRTGPFHDALRAAIDRSGLTLDRLRERLARRGIHVSLASLSYWRLGRSRPERPDSLRAVQAIEAILGLPKHSLEALLGPPRPRGRWVGRATATKRYGNLLEPARALAETVDMLVGPSDGKLRPRYLDDAVVLDGGGAVREIRSRQVVRAVGDEPDRHIAVYCEEPGTDPSAVDVLALENCRVGRVRRHPHAPVIAAELLFDRALRTGQTHLFEYKVTVADGLPTTVYRRAFRYPAETYVASVRFHSGRLPVRCWGFVQQGEDPVQAVEEELPMSAGHLVHISAGEVIPGVLGVEWEWA